MQHIGVSELREPEVIEAQERLQKGEAPEAIIHRLRGAAAAVLDPDQFSRDVQMRALGLKETERRTARGDSSFGDPRRER